MNTCERCKGLVHVSNPRKVVDGKVYHLHCGFQAEKEMKETKVFCTHCFKPIVGAYATIFVKHIRMDFHLECQSIFKKEVLGENRIPKE